MSKTKIQWTNETWNVTTGCSKISEGCKNCYAETMHKRLNAMGVEKYKEPFNKICFHREELKKPSEWKNPRMVFVNSMSDLFHEDVPDRLIKAVIEEMCCYDSPHTFQVLTKRPERMKESLSPFNTIYIDNIWFGVTTENQKEADHRIPILLRTPAKVRFASVEPMLEKIDLLFDLMPHRDNGNPPIDWVIVGCESGAKRRPCKIEWIEDIVDQCKKANVPVFVKQISINGKVIKDIEQFPKHLQVREFPKEVK
jgi:protein gp37